MCWIRLVFCVDLIEERRQKGCVQRRDSGGKNERSSLANTFPWSLKSLKRYTCRYKRIIILFFLEELEQL